METYTVENIINTVTKTYPAVDFDVTDESITIFEAEQFFGSISLKSDCKWGVSCINKKHIYDVLCENRFEYQYKVTAVYQTAEIALAELVMLYEHSELIWK